MPHMHWTSHLRRRAGYKPYDHANPNASSFTIQDTSGQLKVLLSKKGYQQVKFLTDNPTFHIQVVVSEGSVHSAFDIDTDQVKKVSIITSESLWLLTLS